MKNKIRMTILMICACTMMLGINAFAESTDYTITVTRSGANEDNISKRTLRTDCYINDFSVTPLTFNTNNASFWAKSIQLYGSVESEEIYVENGIGESRYGRYTTTAPCDVYYFMKARYGYSSTGIVKSTGVYEA